MFQLNRFDRLYAFFTLFLQFLILGFLSFAKLIGAYSGNLVLIFFIDGLIILSAL
jgi:hypothetical protein